MKLVHCSAYVVFGAIALSSLIPALTGPVHAAKAQSAAKQELPPGEGKDLLVKQGSGCHQLAVVTSQHKSESRWTDTVVEMRNRGANGSDEDMEQIIRYLTANFGPLPASPARLNVNAASASDMVSGLSLTQADANAIVAYRDKNGKYKDIAGLKQVPGIDAAKIDAAKDKIDF